MRSVEGDLLADEVVAHGPGGGKLDEWGIPALDLRLLEQLLQEVRRELGVEGERRLRQRVGEFRGVAAAWGGDRDQAALTYYAVGLGEGGAGIREMIKDLEDSDTIERLVWERKCGSLAPNAPCRGPVEHRLRAVETDPGAVREVA